MADERQQQLDVTANELSTAEAPNDKASASTVSYFAHY